MEAFDATTTSCNHAHSDRAGTGGHPVLAFRCAALSGPRAWRSPLSCLGRRPTWRASWSLLATSCRAVGASHGVEDVPDRAPRRLPHRGHRQQVCRARHRLHRLHSSHSTRPRLAGRGRLFASAWCGAGRCFRAALDRGVAGQPQQRLRRRGTRRGRLSVLICACECGRLCTVACLCIMSEG